MPWPTTLSMTCLLGASILSTPNAADDYRELDDRWQQISEDDQNRIMPWNLPPYYTPTPQTERAIQKLAEIDAIITRGARKERCDFGLDYAQGPAMLVPHLSPMRLITEALETIVRLRRLQGEHAKAATCMDAMYAMGFQLAQDGTVISSLVGISIFRMSDDMVAEAIEAGDIGPAEASLLLKRLKAADEDDPFGLINSIAMEKTLMGNWVERELDAGWQEDGSFELSEETQDMFQMLALQQTEDWSKAFLKQELDGYYRYMDDSLAAFAMEPHDAAKAELAALEAKLMANEYGSFAKLLAMSHERILEQQQTMMAQLADRIAALEMIASGEEDLLEQANAAWWYMRTAHALQAMTAEQRDDEATRDAMLAQLLMATIIDRCEFPVQDPVHALPQPIVPPWSAGMRTGLQLLLDDAERLASSGHVDDAVAQLSIVFEIAADLSSTIHLIDSVIAQEATERALQVIESIDEAQQMNSAQQRLLLESLRAIPASDPFGYNASADATRRMLVSHIGSDHPLSDHARAFPSSPDDVLYTTAWCEQVIEPSSPYSFIWPLHTDWRALAGVLEEETVMQVRALGIDAREAASVGVQVNLEPRPLTSPTLKQRRQAAATLLRDWKRRLGQ